VVRWETRWATLGVAALALSLFPCRAAWAQFGGVVQQVAGVWIDSEGVLRSRDVDETNKVRAARIESLRAAPGNDKGLGLRKVSLRRLEEAIAEHRKTGAPLDDDM